MATITKTIEINAPVARVWQEVVCQTDRMSEWMPHVAEARLLSHRPDEIGARPVTREITDLVDQQYLAYRVVTGTGSERGYWRFEPVGATRCRLTLFLDYRLPGGLLGRLADALGGQRAQEERIAEGLHTLKRRCERSSRLTA